MLTIIMKVRLFNQGIVSEQIPLLSVCSSNFIPIQLTITAVLLILMIDFQYLQPWFLGFRHLFKRDHVRSGSWMLGGLRYLLLKYWCSSLTGFGEGVCDRKPNQIGYWVNLPRHLQGRQSGFKVILVIFAKCCEGVGFSYWGWQVLIWVVPICFGGPAGTNHL